MAGLNLEPTFLNEDETDKVSRIERICDHAMHLIDRGRYSNVWDSARTLTESQANLRSVTARAAAAFRCAAKERTLRRRRGADCLSKHGARDPGRHEIEKSCTWKISPVAAGNHLAGKENIVYTFWWLHYSKKRN